MTNWYALFYWLVLADGIKQVLTIVSVITLVISCISLIGYFFSTSSLSAHQNSGDKDSYETKQWLVWTKAWRTAFISMLIVSFITGFLWMFIPTKKDALIIIAGGAVGNFVTRDSSAKAIPSEVMMLLRTKIKEEINETTIKEALSGETDTLKNKTKEQLLEILKNKK